MEAEPRLACQPQAAASPRFWAARHPRPSPQPPRPPAQGLRWGRPPLVVCLEGKEERERGEAQSGPGGGPDRELHHSCLRVFQP